MKKYRNIFFCNFNSTRKCPFKFNIKLPLHLKNTARRLYSKWYEHSVVKVISFCTRHYKEDNENCTIIFATEVYYKFLKISASIFVLILQ